MYILGYIYKDSRLYTADRDMNIVSFTLPLNLLEYQICVLRGDLDLATKILSTLTNDLRTKAARFL